MTNGRCITVEVGSEPKLTLPVDVGKIAGGTSMEGLGDRFMLVTRSGDVSLPTAAMVILGDQAVIPHNASSF